ncbi:PIN domain-containing protein [Niveispirillum sp. SYP-B3756]|uniref:type II toxin-antitoxin system VapC family toxin n=1 Tax=Niveispirillum sp. SYP-B3756 TaxID=2662178 RepID=UPI001290993A|nr:type II toxin-antitoxin system VapC family toxin [Niveispirillum sp. SYP-B3756]MQP68374.1 PIN domain-containing protein [Niveispirillum sp. SYP-B3756]
MFLLDTVVLSELRKRDRNPGIVAWISEQPTADLFISTVTIGEIERGIGLQRSKDAAFAASLTTWLDRVLTTYGERILPFDLKAARRWGRLSAGIGHEGADLMIAATGLEHRLTVVTRNVRHFQPTGVATLNPFS